jgi:hypothetical protein
MIFDETAHCPSDVFECAGDKKMEESIFIHKELQSFNRDKMNHYFHLHHHPSLFLLSHLKQRLLRRPPLPQQQWRYYGLRERSYPTRELPLIFRRHIHPNKS